ncbi:MAG: hypothetical protein ACE5F1_18780, partial [Planctomycetota bacterium]
ISELEEFRDELREDVRDLTRLPDEAELSLSEDPEEPGKPESGSDDESQADSGKDGEGTAPPFGYRS